MSSSVRKFEHEDVSPYKTHAKMHKAHNRDNSLRISPEINTMRRHATRRGVVQPIKAPSMEHCGASGSDTAKVLQAYVNIM